MLLNDTNRARIETLLLGGNRHFQSEQVTVINSNHSTNIMACPGSGKTTVLIAKISLILEQLKNEGSNKGICVITHTNVAVEEIIKSLNKLGISNIAYPHFIGTIHEFINNFFSFKGYGAYTHKDTIYLMDNDEYKKHFERIFEYHKPNSWSVATPITAVDRTDIQIDSNGRFGIISRRPNGGNYNVAVLNTIKDMFDKGYLRHDDTLELAKWYIRNHKEAIQQAFENRFQYFFIDEAQDTSIDQYETLSMLIENNQETIVQWYGDSYQALYSLYGKEDAWRPSLEESLQINYSNRFGENIANILRTTCIEEYSTLSANVAINSAVPHLFIYNNENKEHLLNIYCRIVSEFKAASVETADIKGKIAAVCHHHHTLEGYSKTYQRSKVSKPLYSQMQACLHECHQLLLNELRINDRRTSEVRGNYLKNISQFLKDNHPAKYVEIKSIWAKWIRAINDETDESLLLVELSAKYKELFATVLNTDSNQIELTDTTNLRNRLVKILAKNQQPISVESAPSSSIELNLELNTIHGVKGETHFATLLLESIREGESDIRKIFNFLIGNYQSELTKDTFVKDTLKLAYVALSRPRYFAGVAMNEEHISNQDIENAIRHGWKIVKIENFVHEPF